MAVLVLLGLIVCGVVWHLYRGELEIRREDQRQWQKESILAEAEGTILDFLDYGGEIAQATRGKYRGTISVRMHSLDKSGEVGFCLTMHDSGDIGKIPEEVLDSLHLKAFVKRYGYYYDEDRDAIRYLTSRGIKLDQEERTEMEQTLFRRIRNHPLAIMKSDTVICTRGI